MFTSQRKFLLITLLTAFALYIALPSSFNVSLPFVNFQRTLTKLPVEFTLLGERVSFNPQLRLGLDLQGGTHLLLEADMSEIPPQDRVDALESSHEIIARRVDLFGVTEPLIQTSINEEANQYRLIVELPGVEANQDSISLIGETAQLEFQEENPDFNFEEATMSAVTLDQVFTPTGLTGKQLRKARVDFDPQTGEPVVTLEFNSEGAQLFGDITQRNIGSRVAIVLDDQVIMAPVVNGAILDGQAVIQGGFDTESAKNLSIQLNAGALPVPIEVISQRNVGATLGEISIQQSLFAGLVGLAMVMIFMVAYYGWLGFLADIALIIYAILTLALYKLLSVTITLPGLAGFILSVGMAVDANILIFERMKEEIRAGVPWQTAVELGFGRAWDAIKDANVATLTICFILFNPFNWSILNTSGIVRGFALTLALGIMISLFTGVVVSRTLIRLFYQGKPVTKKTTQHMVRKTS